jgi:hypothetical protein
MTQYFLTEVANSIVLGHDFGASSTATTYFNSAKPHYPQAKFVNLVRLNIALSGTDGAGSELILNKYSNQLEAELKEKYPAAVISHFDQF